MKNLLSVQIYRFRTVRAREWFIASFGAWETAVASALNTLMSGPRLEVLDSQVRPKMLMVQPEPQWPLEP